MMALFYEIFFCFFVRSFGFSHSFLCQTMTDCEFLVVMTPLTFQSLMQNLPSTIHAKFQKIQTMHVEITDNEKIRLRPKCYVTHCVSMQSFGTLSVISRLHKMYLLISSGNCKAHRNAIKILLHHSNALKIVKSTCIRMHIL